MNSAVCGRASGGSGGIGLRPGISIPLQQQAAEIDEVGIEFVELNSSKEMVNRRVVPKSTGKAQSLQVSPAGEIESDCCISGEQLVATCPESKAPCQQGSECCKSGVQSVIPHPEGQALCRQAADMDEVVNEEYDCGDCQSVSEFCSGAQFNQGLMCESLVAPEGEESPRPASGLVACENLSGFVHQPYCLSDVNGVPVNGLGIELSTIASEMESDSMGMASLREEVCISNNYCAMGLRPTPHPREGKEYKRINPRHLSKEMQSRKKGKFVKTRNAANRVCFATQRTASLPARNIACVQSISSTAPESMDIEQFALESMEKQSNNVSSTEKADFYFSLDWEDKFTGDFVSDKSFSNFLTGVDFLGNSPPLPASKLPSGPSQSHQRPGSKDSTLWENNNRVFDQDTPGFPPNPQNEPPSTPCAYLCFNPACPPPVTGG